MPTSSHPPVPAERAAPGETAGCIVSVLRVLEPQLPLLRGMPAALDNAGMRGGDVVLVGIRPSVERALVILAAVRLGACIIEAPTMLPAHAAQRVLDDVRPSWVIAEPLLYLAGARTPIRGRLQRQGFELPRLAGLDARHVRVGGWLPGVPRGAVAWRDLEHAAATYDGSDHLPAPSDTSIAWFDVSIDGCTEISVRSFVETHLPDLAGALDM